MSQEQGQTQDQQNELQTEYPANEESGYNETQDGVPQGTGTGAQTEQVDEPWRPADDPAIEQAGGTTQSTEEEPGRSQQDGRSHGEGDGTIEPQGKGAGGGGV